MRQLRVRLGSRCNLDCSFCHSKRLTKYFEYKPEKILEYFLKNHFTAISFIGGEPTLFMDTIVDMAKRLPKGTRISYTTNGSTMEGRVLEDTLKYNIVVAMSINECVLGTTKFEGLKQLPLLETSSVFSGSKTLDEIDEEYDYVSKMLGYNKFPVYTFAHHIDSNASAFKHREEDIDEFVNGIHKRLWDASHAFVRGRLSRYSRVLAIVNSWFRPMGFGCFHNNNNNNNYRTITADGRPCLCSYSDKIFDTEEEMLKNLPDPFDCSSCIIPKEQCRVCYLSLDDYECRMMRKMYKLYLATLKKYDIDYKRIEEVFSKVNFYAQGDEHIGFCDSF